MLLWLVGLVVGKLVSRDGELLGYFVCSRKLSEDFRDFKAERAFSSIKRHEKESPTSRPAPAVIQSALNDIRSTTMVKIAFIG